MQKEKLKEYKVHHVGKYIPNPKSDRKNPITLQYESSSDLDQFAVFSEIYYKDGWNAYIDGELKPHYRVNYILRAMEIPAGKHIIEFKFEPKVLQIGSTISFISYAFFFFIPLAWLYFNKNKFFKKN